MPKAPNGSVLAYVLEHYRTAAAHDEPWPFAVDGECYAIAWWHGRSSRAHVIACTLSHGERPPGLVAAHECLNPRGTCFWAEHLSWKTPRANTHDRYRDGTMLRGDTSPTAKVTETDVREMREQYARGGFTLSQLGVQYGIKTAAVSHIISRRNWRHVE